MLNSRIIVLVVFSIFSPFSLSWPPLISYGWAQTNDDILDYSKDVAPIIQEKCAGCHRPGQSAPFSLLNYSDVERHADTIEAVIDDGYMPPWKPVAKGIAYSNDRRLSSKQETIIRSWIAQGARKGKVSKAKQLDGSRPTGKMGRWRLGDPDLIVRMQRPFEVPSEGKDIYRSFVFELDSPNDRWVKALELRPTSQGAVHHALFFVDTSGRARSKCGRDGKPGFGGMSFLTTTGFGFDGIAKSLNQGLGGFVPGAIPNRLPDDLARLLPAGSDIVMQTHFHSIGRMVEEQAELGIYFADRPPRQQLVSLQIPALFGIGAGINIEAGESNYVINDSFTMPIDVEAVVVGGHAHYICKSMRLTAEMPDRDKITLLQIDDWDLDWQDQYQFEKRVALPKGTVLRVHIVYDNSSANIDNPFTPPRRISWGRESTDEMGSMILQVVARNEDERPLLESAIEKSTRSSLRHRIKSQSTAFTRLTGFTPGPGMLLKFFDRNRDGSLQSGEIPASHRDRLLEFFDSNRDDTLGPAELRRARKLLDDLMNEPLDVEQEQENPKATFKHKQDVFELEATNMLGETVRLFEGKNRAATVVFFIKPDCPIANSFVPTMERLKTEFQKRNVRFVAIHSSAHVTAEDAKLHAAKFSISLPLFLDPELEIAHGLGASVTPQAVVVDRNGTIRYRGRIDDTYAGFGKRRPNPTCHDVSEALLDILAGRSVRMPETKAIGCLIQK